MQNCDSALTKRHFFIMQELDGEILNVKYNLCTYVYFKIYLITIYNLQKGLGNNMLK